MSREELQAILDGSPVAKYHRLLARDDGSVRCVVRKEETGADGYLCLSVIDLMLRAVGHGLVEKSTMGPRFQMDEYGKVRVGAVVVATGRIALNTDVRDVLIIIEAELHEEGASQGVSSERVASAAYGRRRTK